jgi:phosphate transport system permease protein
MRSQSLELRRESRARAPELLLLVATGTATAIVLLVLAILLVDIAVGGAEAISWRFVSSAPRRGLTEGGIFPAIFGTVVLTLLMTVAAVPAGVATAVFLTEYAPADSKLARAIRVCIANLAGVPSIVFGLFGLGFFVSTLGRGIDRVFYDGRLVYATPSLVWASLTLAILTLPVVVVATEEALRSVPREIRDASLALGATKLQTVTKVVMPEALGGVLTGTILAISRGAGEVAPIMFTGVAYFMPYLPSRLNDQFMSLSYHVYVLATQSPNVDKTKPLLYGTALVLLALTFLLNLTAVVLRARTRAQRRAAE